MKHYPKPCLLLMLGLLSACGSPPRTERTVTRGLDATDRALAKGPEAAADEPAPPRPLATVDGRAVSLEQLKPALLEAAGAVALEEAVLDELLAREASAKGLAIASAQLDAERDRLLDSFATAGAARSPDEAARLLQSIRAARGLGDKRFAALLRRNATLRALVQPEVAVTPAAIEQARELRFGPRYRARLIITPTAGAATDALRRLDQGENFSTLAAEVSTDASADRGGILEPISPADPAYPAAIRSTLRDMQPGGRSQPTAIDQGFAILRLDEVIASSSPAPNDAATQAALERDVRTTQERILMNQLARRLLDSASITILDRGLDEAWRMRTRRP